MGHDFRYCRWLQASFKWRQLGIVELDTQHPSGKKNISGASTSDELSPRVAVAVEVSDWFSGAFSEALSMACRQQQGPSRRVRATGIPAAVSGHSRRQRRIPCRGGALPPVHCEQLPLVRLIRPFPQWCRLMLRYRLEQQVQRLGALFLSLALLPVMLQLSLMPDVSNKSIWS